MKSFKEMVKPRPIEEAMGKRNAGFKGVDEIGKFWIVSNKAEGAELIDILWEADVFDMHLQLKGGLRGDEIVGIYKSKAKATKIAKNELAGAGAE